MVTGQRPLKVAQLTAYYPPHLGGVENVARHLAEGLAERHRVWVLTSDADANSLPRRQDRGNLTVKRYHSRTVANVPLFPGAIAGVLGLPRGTILHAHMTQAFVPEVAALGAARGVRPLVAHYHMDVIATGRGNVYTQWKRFMLGPILRMATRVLVLSGQQGNDVIERYGVVPSRVLVLPNGVEDVYFQPRMTERARAGSLRILFVGRLSPQKDLPLMLAAVSRLGAGAELVVVGDGELRPQVENLARSGRLQMKLVGVQSPEQVAGWYRWADVLLSSSEREGMPLTLLEAMASGLPIVATDVPGTRETVAGAAMLVERTPEALAAAIKDLQQNPQRAKTMSDEGRRIVQSRRWPEIIRQLEDIYCDISGR